MQTGRDARPAISVSREGGPEAVQLPAHALEVRPVSAGPGSSR